MNPFTTILAIVTANAREDKVEDQSSLSTTQRVLRVFVTAAPERGRANRAVVELVAHHLGIAPSLVALTRGHRGRRKLLTVPRMSKRL